MPRVKKVKFCSRQVAEMGVRPYEQTKSSLHFTPVKPLPKSLVHRLIKARVAECNE